jgi:threonine 3-dehydrogenase
MAAAIAEQAGARRVVLTDINDWRLEFAKTITNKTHMVNTSQQNLKEVMTEIGMKEGFDVGLEMSGSEPAFNQMLDVMLMGGNVALLGIPAKSFPFDIGKLVIKALTLKGIYGREMYETWYKMLALLDSGLDMSPMITHRFAAQDFQQAFDLMETGKTGKVILDWTNI